MKKQTQKPKIPTITRAQVALLVNGMPVNDMTTSMPMRLNRKTGILQNSEPVSFPTWEANTSLIAHVLIAANGKPLAVFPLAKTVILSQGVTASFQKGHFTIKP